MAEIWRIACPLCKSREPRPCPHTGVRVWIPRSGRWTVSVELGEYVYEGDYFRGWVWPENAWRYDLVEEEQED